MKKILTESGKMYLGEAREIKSLYKKFLMDDSVYCLHNEPKYRMYSVYAVLVNEYDYTGEHLLVPEVHVIDSDTIVRLKYEL